MVETSDQIGDCETDKQIKTDYQILSVIGKGSFATVRKGKHRETKEKVAIKIMSKKKMNEEDVAALQNEIEIMRQVNHPNIVNMSAVYEDKAHHCLVMELMQGGELFDHIITKTNFSEQEAHKFMVPLFDAMMYCHDMGIVHRDLKPENLLFCSKDLSNATIKISDFGLARYISSADLATTTCGTPGYVAPEILKKTVYDHRCDYWSMAVVMFIMLSGTPPFFDDNQFELFEIIKTGKYSFDAPAWADVSEEAKNLIKGLLVVNPDHRMTKEQIKYDPWIRGDFAKSSKKLNILESMRTWNVSRRCAKDFLEN